MMGGELPKGWVKHTLEAVCLKPQYGWTTKAKVDGDIHLLRTTDITSGSIDWKTVPYCTDAPDKLRKYLLRDGDIVVSRAGSVGCSILVDSPPKSVFASYLIRFLPLIDKKYTALFLQSPSYWSAISEKSSGIALLNVNANKLGSIELPIPPLPEQKRIVAKIEELFSDLDAGVETLKQIQVLIKRYRQSVLKSAFEGKLTKEWREKNKAKLEPASVLIERIRLNRLQLIKFGKLRKARERPQPVSCDDLKRLPEQWIWGQIENYSALENNAIVDGPFGSNLKLTDYSDDGIYPVISISNIDKGYDLNTLRKITEVKYQELKRSTIRSGDILVAKIGSSYGKIGIYPSDMPDGIIPANLLKITVNIEMPWRYLFYYLKSLTFKMFLDLIVQYTAQPAFNVSKFKLLPIPIPPVTEQHIIVEEIETCFSVADKIEEIVEQSLKQSQRLRQSILKRAFEGKLVPQDPRDEPAETLLERIREEKLKSGKARPEKKSRRRKTSHE